MFFWIVVRNVLIDETFKPIDVESINTIILLDEVTGFPNSTRTNWFYRFTLKSPIRSLPTFGRHKKSRVENLTVHETFTVFISPNKDLVPDHLNVSIESHQSTKVRYWANNSGVGSTNVRTSEDLIIISD